jgi:acetyl esterase/lipase
MVALVMQVASAEDFAANVKVAGGSCELHIYEGAGHAFLNNPDSKSNYMP